MARFAKMIEFRHLFAPQIGGKPIFKAFGSNGGFPIMQGLTRIAVRKNRSTGHPSDRNRITYARANPANRESASGSCIHPQKNLPEEFFATRKARRRAPRADGSPAKRVSAKQAGGAGGIRTLDTPLERITV